MSQVTKPVELSYEEAAALYDEILHEYTDESFQRELRAAFSAAGEDMLEQVKARQTVCFPVQVRVITKYGFEGTRRGVSASVAQFKPYNDFPEMMQRNEASSWLLSPYLQQVTPKPRWLLDKNAATEQSGEQDEVSQLWEVVGGKDGGILVRQGQGFESEKLPDRLATGSLISELELIGERLHYKLVKGSGPEVGWVSRIVKGQDLVVKTKARPPPASTDTGPLPESAKETSQHTAVGSLSDTLAVLPFLHEGLPPQVFRQFQHLFPYRPVHYGVGMPSKRAPSPLLVSTDTEDQLALVEYIRSDPSGPFAEIQSDPLGKSTDTATAMHFKKWGFAAVDEDEGLSGFAADDEDEGILRADWHSVHDWDSRRKAFLSNRVATTQQAPLRIIAFCEVMRNINLECWRTIVEALEDLMLLTPAGDDTKSRMQLLKVICRLFRSRCHFADVECTVWRGKHPHKTRSLKDSAASLLQLALVLDGQCKVHAGSFPDPDSAPLSGTIDDGTVNEDVWDDSCWAPENIHDIEMDRGLMYLYSPFILEHATWFDPSEQGKPTISLQCRFMLTSEEEAKEVRDVRGDDLLEVTKVVNDAICSFIAAGKFRVPCLAEVMLMERAMIYNKQVTVMGHISRRLPADRMFLSLPQPGERSSIAEEVTIAADKVRATGVQAGGWKSKESQPFRFPKGFRWGVATSAHQIEGAWRTDGKGPSIWDHFSHTPGKIKNGATADRACDHYHCYEDDVQLMKQLGIDAYRFSISWPRVQPGGRGPFNKKGIDFYKRLVTCLRINGIEPVVTLYHWDLPQPLQDQINGWLSPKIVTHFVEFARGVFQALGNDVTHWITLNEPWCCAVLGQGTGLFAPGGHSKDASDVYLAAHHMLLAHAHTVRLFRELKAKDKVHGSIGIALNTNWVEPEPATNKDLANVNVLAAERANLWSIGWFADPIFKGSYPEVMRKRCGQRLPEFTSEESELISGSADFLGVNHYMVELGAPEIDNESSVIEAFRWTKQVPDLNMTPKNHIDGDMQAKRHVDKKCKRTDMGWSIAPFGFRKVLLWLHKRYQPKDGLWVTESGIGAHEHDTSAAVADSHRVEYMAAYTAAMHEAIDAGADVRAYFAWSFMDNFEWAEGYTCKFGLVQVDFETLQRTPKKSFNWYKDYIQMCAELEASK